MDRRDFLLAVSAAGVFGRVATALADPRSLVPPTERGRRLIVRGRVFGPDGCTPAAGVRLFVYHTDAEGHYSQPQDDPRLARIKGEIDPVLFERNRLVNGWYRE